MKMRKVKNKINRMTWDDIKEKYNSMSAVKTYYENEELKETIHELKERIRILEQTLLCMQELHTRPVVRSARSMSIGDIIDDCPFL